MELYISAAEMMLFAKSIAQGPSRGHINDPEQISRPVLCVDLDERLQVHSKLQWCTALLLLHEVENAVENSSVKGITCLS